MKFLQVLLNIVVFILGLTVVICLHELGHLLVAKIFNVYCAEYSIGFGPALLDVHKLQAKHAKKKGIKPLYDDENDKENIEKENIENDNLSSALKNMDEEKSGDSSADDFKPMAVVSNGESENQNRDEKIEEESVKYLQKQKGETNFCIRAIPLGGFVSMAGESGELDTTNGLVVPPQRCLNTINRGKQVCIMLAGICMNFILAIFLFFIARLFPYQYSDTSSPIVEVVEGPVSVAGLQTEDKILYLYQEYHIDTNSDGKVDDNDKVISYPYSKEELLDANDNIKEDSKIKQIESYLSSKNGSNQLASYDEAIDNCISKCSLEVFKTVNEKLLTMPKQFIDAGVEVTENGVDTSKYIVDSSYRVIHLCYERDGETKWLNDKDDKGVKIKAEPIDVDSGKGYKLGLLGISACNRTTQDSFSDAIGLSFADFGNNFVGLFKSIGSIFTADGWKQVGGIVSIYKVSSEAVSTGSATTVLRLWGLLSLNVGIFNLLPFPGLDGWQTILTVGEAIARKKIPQKVKGIMNTIGMIVMLLLAGLLIIKDIFIK